jgi:hypothetical protein
LYYFNKANNLFKRFENAQSIKKDSLEKLIIFEQQYNLTFQLIEEIIEKQKEYEHSMILIIIFTFITLFILVYLYLLILLFIRI